MLTNVASQRPFSASGSGAAHIFVKMCTALEPEAQNGLWEALLAPLARLLGGLGASWAALAEAWGGSWTVWTRRAHAHARVRACAPGFHGFWSRLGSPFGSPKGAFSEPKRSPNRSRNGVEIRARKTDLLEPTWADLASFRSAFGEQTC